MKLLNPPPMTMPAVTRAMSAALRRSIQRHVTGLLVRSRRCTRPFEHPQRHGQGQEFDVPGVPEAGPVGQLEDTSQQDEPVAPDRTPCRIQDHVRAGQGARRNPKPYGSYAGPQQAKPPGPVSPSGMRFAITDRMPPYGRAIPRRPPRSGAARAHCINRLGKVLAQQ